MTENGREQHEREIRDMHGEKMKVIGITGGVGAGKSQILSYLKEHTKCRVIMADQVAHELEKPGMICYEKLLALMGKDILAENGEIDKAAFAARIFARKELLAQVNEIVHPAVKEYILQAVAEEMEKGQQDYLFIEAALLIEDGYEEIVDEMWYIHTDEAVRRARLKESRGYTDEKIDSIMREQLSEEEFYRHCPVVIDNSEVLEHVYRQIDEKLGEDLCQRRRNIRDN